MGDCIRCGKPAGLLRKTHKECEAKRATGIQQIIAISSESVRGKADPFELTGRARDIASNHFVDSASISNSIVQGFEAGVASVLEDGVVDEAEELAVAKFSEATALSQSQLDIRGAYTRLVRGAVLRELMNGRGPGDRLSVQGALPFMMQKGESLLWVFPKVEYYETKTRSQWVGGSAGVSIKIAKGVYYRVGKMNAEKITAQHTELESIGTLAVTNKHVMFDGTGKDFRIKHDKIVSVSPFADGVQIQRDAATAKPQTFKTGDGWFAYNLIMNARNVGAHA